MNIFLIDGIFDQSQSQNIGIESDRCGSIASQQRYMVQTSHDEPPSL
jgi:hypothetical protein